MDLQIEIKSIIGIIGAITAFSLMFWVLRRTIGWSDFKKAYGFSGSYSPIVTRHFTTCWMNGIRGTYNLGANLTGLYVSFPFPLNVGRSPVLIPWKDICTQKGKTFILSRDVIEFSFEKMPNTCFQVKTKICKDIAAAVGDKWPKNCLFK